MSQQVFDIDTTGFGADTLGNFFDFYVNNTFYLLAPEYYQSFYSIYLNRCLSVYDGWVRGWHNAESGLVPQRMLQSVSRGINNMVFGHGIDFNGDKADYEFACKWAKKSKLGTVLKKAHLFDIAGGTSLIKLNRADGELFVTAHRIDTYFADISPSGKVLSVKVFFDIIHNTNPSGSKTHYGICEERYFADGEITTIDKNGEFITTIGQVPYVKCSVYKASSNLQTEVQSRPTSQATRVNWENLSREVKNEIKNHYPSIIIDKEERLPFNDSLGCFLLKFTEEIGQIPNTPLGQPIGDILFTENFQYDQMKYFEKNEVDLARARALIPEPMWNKDDPAQDSRALNERFYQKVSSIDGDSDKITPIQFLLRGEDIRKQKENILKDIAFKLNMSASSIASFLSEGNSAKTATEVVSERTKTDTFIDGQIQLLKPDIDEMLSYVMKFYDHNPVEIIFRTENQSPELDLIKTYGDQLTAGNISIDLFVRKVHKNLSQAQQKQEIDTLTEQKQLRDEQQRAMANIYNAKTQ